MGAVGGNGGNAAADAIQQECEQQHVECSVVGVPKSIDNDILLVRKHANSPVLQLCPEACNPQQQTSIFPAERVCMLCSKDMLALPCPRAPFML